MVGDEGAGPAITKKSRGHAPQRSRNMISARGTTGLRACGVVGNDEQHQNDEDQSIRMEESRGQGDRQGDQEQDQRVSV